MADLQRYLDAATRENTRRSYESALRHFEVEWGGLLPASSQSVAHYLADHAGRLAANTLRQRLAALAHWHAAHGFADPTRAPVVRQVLRGIRALHPSAEKRAAPLQLAQLAQVADWLERAALPPGTGAGAGAGSERAAQLRGLRDRALLLLGFWRGFRGDELLRLRAEHLTVLPGQGMTCYLTRSKGDRQGVGATYKVPALSRLCPVGATAAWLAAAPLEQGPLFRGIDRWGRVAAAPLHPNSLIRLLRELFTRAGLAAPHEYSSHSLRRGFAGWANANGWDVKSLMEYVGWKDVHSALRYVDGADPFARQRIELGLAASEGGLSAPLRSLPAGPAHEPEQRSDAEGDAGGEQVDPGR
jgi:site-specific recombinase XerD